MRPAARQPKCESAADYPAVTETGPNQIALCELMGESAYRKGWTL